MDPIERKIINTIKKKKFKCLGEAVSEISVKYGIKREEVAKKIFFLWKRGYIDIYPPEKYRSFYSYLFSIDSLWFWLLTILIFVTVFTVFYVSKPPLIYIRYILGSLYVLYIPGATLIEALYPRGEELEPLERLALSIGLSLAIVPLIGLILNYTPWGIRLAPVTIGLASVSLLLACIAVKRKYEYVKLME